MDSRLEDITVKDVMDAQRLSPEDPHLGLIMLRTGKDSNTINALPPAKQGELDDQLDAQKVAYPTAGEDGYVTLSNGHRVKPRYATRPELKRWERTGQLQDNLPTLFADMYAMPIDAVRTLLWGEFEYLVMEAQVWDFLVSKTTVYRLNPSPSS